jgi:glycerophosphoryl diester phosphodiesterase
MLIYAHRGASRDFPELTAAAYQGAIAQGADGFECDLRLSRDEVPLLWHNASLMEQTSHPGLIGEMNFAQIKRIYPDVLTLDDFFDIALAASKGVLLETKHPVLSGNKIEEIVAERIEARDVLNKIDLSVISFSWGAIEKLHRINRNIPTGFLTRKGVPFIAARLSSANAIAPGISQLRAKPELIERVRASGRATYVWTVDEESDVKLCRDLGVDILITNMPAQARSFL